MRKVLMVLMALALVAVLLVGVRVQVQALGSGVNNKPLCPPSEAEEIPSGKLRELKGKFFYVKIWQNEYCHLDGALVKEKEYTFCLGLFCRNL